MNQDLLKWLVHQPAQLVAMFCLGGVIIPAHPEIFQPVNLVILLASVAGIGGGYLSFQQQVSKAARGAKEPGSKEA